MLLETDDEETLVLDDFTLELELTDETTDFCTLSLTFELNAAEDDEVSETLFWKLSWTFFSAFCTKLDCTFPSTFFSTNSATLFCVLLPLSMMPVAVFSTLDCNSFKIFHMLKLCCKLLKIVCVCLFLTSEELSDEALELLWTPLLLISATSILCCFIYISVILCLPAACFFKELREKNECQKIIFWNVQVALDRQLFLNVFENFFLCIILGWTFGISQFTMRRSQVSLFSTHFSQVVQCCHKNRRFTCFFYFTLCSDCAVFSEKNFLFIFRSFFNSILKI